jgi:hypothetical protein
LAKSVLAITVVTFLFCSVCAEAVVIEAEDYVTAHDEGGATIYITTCSGASGGRAIEGFDWPGDWIEVVFNVSEAGSMADSLRSAGVENVASGFKSTIVGAGPGGVDLSSSYDTMGLGIG